MNVGYQALISRTLNERTAYAALITQRYPDHYPVILIPYEGTPSLTHPKYLVPKGARLQHITNEIIRGLGLLSGQSAVYFYRYPLPFLNFCVSLVQAEHEHLPSTQVIDEVYEKHHAEDNLLYLIYRVC